MPPQNERRRIDWSLQIGTVVQIVMMALMLAGVFYGTKVSSAEDFATDRNRITALEVNMTNLQKGVGNLQDTGEYTRRIVEQLGRQQGIVIKN